MRRRGRRGAREALRGPGGRRAPAGDRREALDSPIRRALAVAARRSRDPARDSQEAGCSLHSRRCATCSACKSPDARTRLADLAACGRQLRADRGQRARVGVGAQRQHGRIDHYVFYPCAELSRGGASGRRATTCRGLKGRASSTSCTRAGFTCSGHALPLVDAVEDVGGSAFSSSTSRAGSPRRTPNTAVTLHFSGTAAAECAYRRRPRRLLRAPPHARVVMLLFGSVGQLRRAGFVQL